MKKLILCILAEGLFVLTACGSDAEPAVLAEYQDLGGINTLSSDKEDDEQDAQEEDTAPKQAYTSLTYAGQTAMYRFLDSYDIVGNGFGFTIYLPGSEAELNNGAAESTLHGVTLSYGIGSAGNESVYDILSDAYQTEKKRIGSLANTEDVEVPDAISGDSWALQEIDFKSFDDTAKYACYSYIKVDLIDDISVITRVTLMGDQADDSTQSVFTEAISAAGITVEDVEFGETKD